MSSCSFLNCSNNSRNFMFSFHRFPIDNEVLAQKWIERSGNNTMLTLNKQQLRQKRVCRSHFLDDDFCFPNSKMLKKNVIPQFYDHVEVQEEVEEQDLVLNLGDTSVKTYSRIAVKSIEERYSEVQNQSLDKNIAEIMNKTIKNGTESNNKRKPRGKSENFNKKYIDSLKKRIHNLKSIIKRLKKSNRNLKSKSTLGGQISKYEFETEGSRIIAKMQLKTKRRLWTEEEKNYCTCLFYTLGTANYKKLIKSGMILPAVSTLHTWFEQHKYLPGLSPSF